MSHNTKRRIAGFTMIELMIAMAVTMVLLYAALRAFRDASQSSKQISLASDMTDNLRAGLNYIQQDLVQAGSGIPTTGIPIPNTPNGLGTCNAGAALNRPSLTAEQFSRNAISSFPPSSLDRPWVPSLLPRTRLLAILRIRRVSRMRSL